MQYIEAIWPDGHRDAATSWRDLETVLRREQYHRWRRRAFRQEMAHRAMVLGRTRISTRGSSERFLRELERVGMCRLSVTETEEVTK